MGLDGNGATDTFFNLSLISCSLLVRSPTDSIDDKNPSIQMINSCGVIVRSFRRFENCIGCRRCSNSFHISVDRGKLVPPEQKEELILVRGPVFLNRKFRTDKSPYRHIQFPVCPLGSYFFSISSRDSIKVIITLHFLQEKLARSA